MQAHYNEIMGGSEDGVWGAGGMFGGPWGALIYFMFSTLFT
jgi:hypothetical protein